MDYVSLNGLIGGFVLGLAFGWDWRGDKNWSKIVMQIEQNFKDFKRDTEQGFKDIGEVLEDVVGEFGQKLDKVVTETKLMKMNIKAVAQAKAVRSEAESIEAETTRKLDEMRELEQQLSPSLELTPGEDEEEDEEEVKSWDEPTAEQSQELDDLMQDFNPDSSLEEEEEQGEAEPTQEEAKANALEKMRRKNQGRTPGGES